eukprot:Hpha_TRINITY_DN13101_c1_g1::TRINITY_DN13101_c1_g1_i1::g.113897::m.113897
MRPLCFACEDAEPWRVELWPVPTLFALMLFSRWMTWKATQYVRSRCSARDPATTPESHHESESEDDSDAPIPKKRRVTTRGWVCSKASKLLEVAARPRRTPPRNPSPKRRRGGVPQVWAPPKFTPLVTKPTRPSTAGSRSIGLPRTTSPVTDLPQALLTRNAAAASAPLPSPSPPKPEPPAADEAPRPAEKAAVEAPASLVIAGAELFPDPSKNNMPKNNMPKHSMPAAEEIPHPVPEGDTLEESAAEVVASKIRHHNNPAYCTPKLMTKHDNYPGPCPPKLEPPAGEGPRPAKIPDLNPPSPEPPAADDGPRPPSVGPTEGTPVEPFAAEDSLPEPRLPIHNYTNPKPPPDEKTRPVGPAEEATEASVAEDSLLVTCISSEAAGAGAEASGLASCFLFLEPDLHKHNSSDPPAAEESLPLVGDPAEAAVETSAAARRSPPSNPCPKRRRGEVLLGWAAAPTIAATDLFPDPTKHNTTTTRIRPVGPAAVAAATAVLLSDLSAADQNTLRTCSRVPVEVPATATAVPLPGLSLAESEEHGSCPGVGSGENAAVEEASAAAAAVPLPDLSLAESEVPPAEDGLCPGVGSGENEAVEEASEAAAAVPLPDLSLAESEVPPAEDASCPGVGSGEDKKVPEGEECSSAGIDSREGVVVQVPAPSSKPGVSGFSACWELDSEGQLSRLSRLSQLEADNADFDDDDDEELQALFGNPPFTLLRGNAPQAQPPIGGQNVGEDMPQYESDALYTFLHREGAEDESPDPVGRQDEGQGEDLLVLSPSQEPRQGDDRLVTWQDDDEGMALLFLSPFHAPHFGSPSEGSGGLDEEGTCGCSASVTGTPSGWVAPEDGSENDKDGRKGGEEDEGDERKEPNTRGSGSLEDDDVESDERIVVMMTPPPS